MTEIVESFDLEAWVNKYRAAFREAFKQRSVDDRLDSQIAHGLMCLAPTSSNEIRIDISTTKDIMPDFNIITWIKEFNDAVSSKREFIDKKYVEAVDGDDYSLITEWRNLSRSSRSYLAPHMSFSPKSWVDYFALTTNEQSV